MTDMTVLRYAESSWPYFGVHKLTALPLPHRYTVTVLLSISRGCKDSLVKAQETDVSTPEPESRWLHGQVVCTVTYGLCYSVM